MVERPVILPRGSFYGITSSVDLGGALFSEVYHAAPRQVPLHGHEAAYFCMLLEGEYNERAGESDVTYAPFTIVFHATGMLHLDTIGETGARFFIVELDERWAALAATFIASEVPLCEVRGGDAVWTALRLYLELRGGALTELTIESALYELIGGLRAMTPVDHDPQRESTALAEIVAMIDADLAAPLSLASLAERVGLHPVHVARVFRRKFNRSGEHIHGRRIQAASRALLEKKRPLAQIAAECGFFDQSHFNRVFKSITGTTPSKYRKQMTR